MASLLSNKEPLIVTNNSGQAELIPIPEHLATFKLLHFFLEEVVKDWKRASAPYQAEIDKFPPGTISPLALKGFNELQPIFLKCIFSYAFFFIATEEAYNTLYSQLNRAKKISGLYITHGKPPKQTETITKLRTVRNWSIAHIPSNKASRISQLAAISWQPLVWESSHGEKWNLDNILFGASRRVLKASDGSVLEESQDIQLPGIVELHKECVEYLEKYDKMCADYLEMLREQLVSKLPSCQPN